MNLKEYEQKLEEFSIMLDKISSDLALKQRSREHAISLKTNIPPQLLSIARIASEHGWDFEDDSFNEENDLYQAIERHISNPRQFES